MKRLCLTIVCLMSGALLTQATAQSLHASAPKSARPHAARARTDRSAASKTASLDDMSLNDLHFSNPYAPPEGAGVSKSGDFPADPYPTPAEPQGGLSISMGKDGGGHTTGGLSWGF